MNTRLFLSLLRQYRQMSDHTRVNYSETILTAVAKRAQTLVDEGTYPDYETAYAHALDTARREYPQLVVPETTP